MSLLCVSCKTDVVNQSATKFSCPDCLKVTIIRCIDCKKNAVQYTCSSCAFTGPN